MDGLAWFLLFAATITGFFIYTQAIDVDATLASKALFMPVFAFSAIVLRILATGLVRAGSITSDTVYRSVIGGGLAYGALILIAVIPSIAPTPSMSALSVPQQLFYGNMGIIEEVFFCFLILAVSATMTRYGLLGALLLTAFLFPIFHIGVYGPGNWTFFAVAFGARLVLSIVYYLTSSLSAVMIAHIAFNVLATPGSVLNPASSAMAMALAFAMALTMCIASLRPGPTDNSSRTHEGRTISIRGIMIVATAAALILSGLLASRQWFNPSLHAISSLGDYSVSNIASIFNIGMVVLGAGIVVLSSGTSKIVGIPVAGIGLFPYSWYDAMPSFHFLFSLLLFGSLACMAWSVNRLMPLTMIGAFALWLAFPVVGFWLVEAVMLIISVPSWILPKPKYAASRMIRYHYNDVKIMEVK